MSADSEFQDDPPDYHPIELAAHSILSSLLDSLHDNFELLHQSQFVLLTRLKQMEQRVKRYQESGSPVAAAEVQSKTLTIAQLRKRLETLVTKLDEINQRLEKEEETPPNKG